MEDFIPLFAIFAVFGTITAIVVGPSYLKSKERREMQATVRAAIDKGDIKVAGNQYTDGWLPANAQRNMEQILTATNNKVDAVVASNDGTAGGAVAAHAAQGLAGKVPVSGQDADRAALNRVARGQQTVSVWKDARELGKKAAEAAVLLSRGTALNAIPGATTWNEGPKKMTMN